MGATTAAISEHRPGGITSFSMSPASFKHVLESFLRIRDWPQFSLKEAAHEKQPRLAVPSCLWVGDER